MGMQSDAGLAAGGAAQLLIDSGQQSAPAHLLGLDCPAHSVTCFIEGLQQQDAVREGGDPTQQHAFSREGGPPSGRHRPLW